MRLLDGEARLLDEHPSPSEGSQYTVRCSNPNYPVVGRVELRTALGFIRDDAFSNLVLAFTFSDATAGATASFFSSGANGIFYFIIFPGTSPSSSLAEKNTATLTVGGAEYARTKVVLDCDQVDFTSNPQLAFINPSTTTSPLLDTTLSTTTVSVKAAVAGNTHSVVVTPIDGSGTAMTSATLTEIEAAKITAYYQKIASAAWEIQPIEVAQSDTFYSDFANSGTLTFSATPTEVGEYVWRVLYNKVEI